MVGNVLHKVTLVSNNTDQHAQKSHRVQSVDAEQVAAMREEMLRFTTLQLRDSVLAEDVVHEALNAALSKNKYSGRGSLKSWVFAILRNKIIDVIRERSRHPTESYIEDDVSDDQFDDRGHWKKSHKPSNWGQPETVLANEQFWLIFDICLKALPENTARVFMMREHLGLELKEVCKELNISDSNAWVIMHRARSQLRKCLEINFIQEGKL